MLYETKVRKVGNSRGIILPEEVLAHFNLKKGDSLFIVPTRDGFELRVYDPEMQKQLQAADECLKKYAGTLRALADK